MISNRFVKTESLILCFSTDISTLTSLFIVTILGKFKDEPI